MRVRWLLVGCLNWFLHRRRYGMLRNSFMYRQNSYDMEFDSCDVCCSCPGSFIHILAVYEMMFILWCHQGVLIPAGICIISTTP